MDKKETVSTLVDHLFRTEYGRLVSFLTYKLGYNYMEIAEDLAQDTLTAAFQAWSFKGIPDHPSAWLFKVAHNKLLNFIEKEKRKYTIYDSISPDRQEEEIHPSLENEIEDSMLRMIFACCSPQISYQNQILLVLNTLGGFSRREIANALLLEEETVKKRLFRVKKEIKRKKILLEVPSGNQLKPRLHAVYNTLYLLYNEGYNSSNNNELIRKDMCLEAMRLSKLMTQQFPKDTTANALFALMCFHTARFDSRIDQQGAIILFNQQCRSSWNRELINAGLDYLARAANGDELSSYHLEAHIAAEHCTAPSFEETNWVKIDRLYHWLYTYKPSPIIKLNIAIVSSKIKGIDFALSQLNYLETAEPKLKNNYLFRATLGEFYHQLGKPQLALRQLKQARSLTHSAKEIDLLDSKIHSLTQN